MIPLRPYQDDALNQLRHFMGRDGGAHRKIILQAVTGSGKTVMASAMIHGAVKNKKVVLFVAHRRELIKQASDKLSAFGVRHGLVLPGEKPSDLDFVHVGTVQSFTARMRRGSFAPEDVALIIFDEAHRSAAKSYTEMMNAYPKARVIGLTATPTRGDGKGLGDIYTAMVQAISYEESFSKGYLVRPKYYAPFTPDLENVKVRGGDYAEEDLEAEMNKPQLTGDIVGHYARICALPEGGYRQGIAFAVNVRHSIALAQAFNSAGILAAHIDGETPSAERDELMRGYRAGEFTVLVNVGIATEGLDVPECSAIVLACPTKSVIKHLQTAGRALRPCPEIGKQDALILDHAGNTLRLGQVEDYNSWSLDKGSTKTAKEREKEKRDPKEITCDSCGHLFYSAKVCPSCGHTHLIERSPKDIDVQDGELVELKGKARVYTQEEKRRWYSEILYACNRKRKANGEQYADGWAKRKYKDKFGVWPDRTKGVYAMPTGPEVQAFLDLEDRRQRDRWHKQRDALKAQQPQAAD